MAVKSSRVLFCKILEKYTCNKFLFTVKQCKTFSPYSISNYSSNSEDTEINLAVKVFLKKNEENEKFLQAQWEEYEAGKKHLANIIGKNVENMTKAEINKAIAYLFPSALFVPKSRPMIKSPDLLFKKESAIPFDKTGRPFHYLFYTTTPKFCSILHEASVQLEKLDKDSAHFVGNEEEPKIVTEGSTWWSLKKLKDICNERLRTEDYEKFLEVFEVLASHPLGYRCQDLIFKYRNQISSYETRHDLSPEVLPDGTIKVLIERSWRKTSSAKVLVTYPGTGIFKINDQDLDYFSTFQSREQVGKFRFSMI